MTWERSQRDTQHELHKISNEIGWYEEEARKAFALALQYKLAIGKRLMQAKTLLPHGKFLSWAQGEFGWSARHVQSHLVLAQNAKQISLLPPGTSMRMALAAIRQLPLSPPQALSIVEAPPTTQRIHLIGEIEEGSLDREELLKELTNLAAKLGVDKIRWRIGKNSSALGW